jgi:hypothetical protein
MENFKNMSFIYRILSISAFIATFYSCEKDVENHLMIPQIPQSYDCDFNDDKIIDFRIEYSSGIYDGFDFLGNPTGGDYISGDLKSLNKNSVLLNDDNGRLFRAINDTIYSNVSDSDYFSSDVGLVSIHTTSGSGSVWEKEWSIAGDLSQDYYYLGFKTMDDDNYLLGWLKLHINKTTGEIVIIDKRTTNKDFIIVGE